MRSERPILASAAAFALLSLCLFAGRNDASIAQSPTPDRSAAASRELREANDVPVRSTLRRELAMLRVLDVVSRRPLQGVRVACSGRVDTTVTDADGRADLPHTVGPTSLQLTLGALSVTRTVRTTPGRDAVVTLPVWAKVVVTANPGVATARGQVHLRPVDRGPAPEGATEGGRRLLALASQHPQSLRDRRAALGLQQQVREQRQAIRFAPGEVAKALTFFTLHAGELAVSATGTYRGSNGRRAVLRNNTVKARAHPGAVTHVTLALHAKPVVCGRLVDAAGRPLAGVRVTAMARADFAPGVNVPHDSDEAGSAALILLRQRGDAGVTGMIRLSRKTNRHGYFAIPMSFTDSVAVWAHPAAYAPVYVERKAHDRFADVTVALQATARMTEERHVALCGTDGTPLADVRVQLLCTDADNRFQCHPPLTRTDAAGRLDLRHCMPGARYLLHFPGSSHGNMTLPVHAERLVVGVKQAR